MFRGGLSKLGAAAMALALTVGVFVPATQAETLKDALARVYRSNPTIKADRARQRGTDELVPQAKSGWRPVVTAQGTVETNSSSSNTPLGGRQRDDSSSAGVNIQLQQPIFSGFKTVNSVKRAKATVEAGRARLSLTEQSVLFEAIQAYMDVLRDRKILDLRQRNVSFLNTQLRAANERFQVGEITRTDVAQSRSSLAQGQAAVVQARANLAGSTADYARLVGREPGKLSNPALAKLPKSLDAAINTAKEVNPNILAASYNQIAAEYDIEVVRGDLLPSLDLQASAGVTDYHGRSSLYSSRFAQVEGVLTVPLYEGGRVYSAVRQAKQVESQRRLQIVETGRGVRASVTTAWANYQAATQAIAAIRTQVEAAQIALNGVQQEYLVGSRTTLDVLNSQSVLVNARITLVSAQHDQVVASYQVLASIGKLTARNLGLGVAVYDPAENYDAVKNKWIGTDANTVE